MTETKKKTQEAKPTVLTEDDSQFISEQTGFTQEELAADWFSPLFIEVNIYLDAIFIRSHQQRLAQTFGNESPKTQAIRLKYDVLQNMVGSLIGGVILENPEDWRAVIAMPVKTAHYKDHTLLYLLVDCEHIEVLSALQEVVGYKAERWQIAMSTPERRNGVTPFFAAVVICSAEFLIAIYRLGGYESKQWQAAMNLEMSSGDHAGETALFAAVFNNRVEIIQTLKRLGGYTQEQWRAVMNTPLQTGKHVGKTSTFVAVSNHNNAILATILKTDILESKGQVKRIQAAGIGTPGKNPASFFRRLVKNIFNSSPPASVVSDSKQLKPDKTSLN